MKKIKVILTETKKRCLASNSVYKKKFQKLFDKMVPDSGKAKTVEGELLRACGKVGYRWFNDGDKFFIGYGCETAGSSATYLMKSSVPGLKELITRAAHSAVNTSSYDKFIDTMIQLVVDYVESKNGKYTRNTVDNLDTRSAWENDDDDGGDYDDEDYEDENENEETYSTRFSR